MARIRKIVYGKTFNVGNYEAEHVRLEAELDDREHTTTEINQIYVTLKKAVHRLQKEG